MMLPSELFIKYFNFSNSQIEKYVKQSPYRYKRYKIKKRNGGYRDIAQPAKDLKVVQRLLIKELLYKRAKIHDAATAYKKHYSILNNAEPHKQNSYILKMDIKNFFPSIKSHNLSDYLTKNEIIDDCKELRILERVFFMKKGQQLILSIGAPSSPYISNILMYDLDQLLYQISSEKNIVYTRYSDDMTFSTNESGLLFDFQKNIREEISKFKGLKLTVNRDKTIFLSKKDRRQITGITITNDNNISIGRRKKREIKSLVFKIDNLSEEKREKLIGYIAFIKTVEPCFIKYLEQRYPKNMKTLYKKV